MAIQFLAVLFRQKCQASCRHHASDINRLEGRFRPAFEEDDFFRDQADIVPGLVLELQTAMV